MELLYRQLLIKKNVEQILFNNMALAGQIRHIEVITPDGSILSSSGGSGFGDQENMAWASLGIGFIICLEILSVPSTTINMMKTNTPINASINCSTGL